MLKERQSRARVFGLRKGTVAGEQSKQDRAGSTVSRVTWSGIEQRERGEAKRVKAEGP